MTTKTQTKPKLKHVIPYNNGKLKMDVTISLDDDCNNGHADFSLTCMAWEKYRGRWEDSFGGCAHEEILKYFPDLQIFANLHLSDQEGVPMYAVENGFYHLWDNKKNAEERIKTVCNYLRTEKAVVIDMMAYPDKDYFQYIIEKYELPKKWKEQAREAITKLEQMTGEKWDYDYNWTRQGYKPLSEEKKKEMLNKVNSGYYSPEECKKRMELARIKKLEDKKAKIKSDLNDKVERETRETNIHLWLLDKLEEIRAKKAKRNQEFLMDDSNFIYYTHSNEVKFNWLGYGRKVTEEELKIFTDSLTEKDLQTLPKGIQFKLEK